MRPFAAVLFSFMAPVIWPATAPAAAWRPAGFLGAQRIEHTATLLPSGQVLIAGGDDGSALARAEIYDPSTGSWASGGDLDIPRFRHTATLLPSGKVLVVGGKPYTTGSHSWVEIYDPRTGSWSRTDSLAEPRASHTATLLPSGEVLVAGGENGDALSSAELYDPAAGTWKDTGSLAAPRSHHTATLLLSGKVLVAGGEDGRSSSGVEIYDPNTGTWTATGSLATPRSSHTATLLPSGKVLVVGGSDGGGAALASAEIYDPSTATWRSGGSLAVARFRHGAVLLPSGKVLIAGGENAGGSLSNAEVFDPDTGSWESGEALTIARNRHTATLLASGRVLVTGGANDDSAHLSSAELYDPDSSSWADTGSLEMPRSGHLATLLPSGEVLIAGGHSSDSLANAELYDPATGSWESTDPMSQPREGHTATLLPTGKVLVAGGFSGAELYDPATGSWESTGSLATARSDHTATLLASGEVLVAGGFNSVDDSTHYLSSAEIYDPRQGSWRSTDSLGTRRDLHTATRLLSGKVLVAGGWNGASSSSAEVFDPDSETWESTASLATPRRYHTATLLASGKVLVAGGENDLGRLDSVEIYDPATGTWESSEPLATPRRLHTATLLPSGKVVVAGGENGGVLASVEVYDPSTRSWEIIRPLTARRFRHSATLLASGEVLIAGGNAGGRSIDSAEILDLSTHADPRRPIIESISGKIRYGRRFTVTGRRFGGDSEASSGGTASSAVNYPLVRLRTLDGSQHAWLLPDPSPNFRDDPLTLKLSDLPPTLVPGHHLLTVITAGVPSEPVGVEVECSVAITAHPESQTVPIGSTATFTVGTQGGRYFQWQKNGVDISGATGPSYITPPITAAESGAEYRVRVASGCKSRTSRPATLNVDDDEPPAARVVSPSGGEFWLLSEEGRRNVEIVTWAMSDNVRVCRVKASLIYSNDGFRSHETAVSATFGPGGVCAHPGETRTSVSYTVPATPPSGAVGSLYKVRIEVTDHAGLTTADESDNPFFIVQPNNESVKTLILTHSKRLFLSEDEVEDLLTALEELADHPRVQGKVIDLAGSSDLDEKYLAWDDQPGSVRLANEVLFAEKGIHDHLLNLLEAFTGVEYLILVGDDRTLPMARIRDRTVLFLESNYSSDDPADLSAGLTARGTTVGAALAADHYLSDDPLAVLDTIRPPDLRREDALFLPDLAVGRLVETHEEMTRAIATFISQEGILDLAALDADEGHKVLVSGYDFLIDGGRNVRRRWKNALGIAPPHDDASLAPVDGELLSPTWGEASVDARRSTFFGHLAGNDGAPYAVVSSSGHATHHELGVPGIDRFDIQGLPAAEIAALDLGGSVVYAGGCHGGLPVAGTDDPADHPFDLPQAMMQAGVQAYLANTGYGWGLVNGVGLSERMVEIFTEELVQGGTVVVGPAMRRAKDRYFLESPNFDDYDAKTSMQWALFGFPMYAVKTGIAAGEKASDGGVTVERLVSGGALAQGRPDAALPDYLTRVEQRFSFAGEGVYAKHRASGEPVPAGVVGCPAPAPGEAAGCYYTLNGLSNGTADLPLQPLFVYDSRLSGTSQHGVLWLGGSYEEEAGWTPVFAELASNGGDGSLHGSTPISVYHTPRGARRRGRRGRLGGEGDDCRASDLDLNSVVVTTGELAKARPNDDTYSLLRLHRTVALEVLYFNDSDTGEGNCDRTGPLFGDGPFHEVRGTRIDFAVPVSDEAGVWRVVVVYSDGRLDAEDRGRWTPLELAADGSETWRESLSLGGPGRLIYYLQAVDRRGNVSWLLDDGTERPASGVDRGIPRPLEAAVLPGTADLSVELTAAEDDTVPGNNEDTVRPSVK